MRSEILVVGILLYSCILAGQNTRQDNYVNLRGDSSDWWSVGSRNFQTSPDIKHSNKEISADNFVIGGLALSLHERDPLAAAYKKFGSATTVERGLSGPTRDQVCYVSSKDPNVHLIFETGELDLVFYLFSGGTGWKGEELCAESSSVSQVLLTESGLRLGITPADVEKILGAPDFSDGTRFIYAREANKRFSATDLTEIQKNNPEMPKAELPKEHDPYLLEFYIEARFTNSHLSYLALLRGIETPSIGD